MMANLLSDLVRKEVTAGYAESETRMPGTREMLLVDFFGEIGRKCDGADLFGTPPLRLERQGHGLIHRFAHHRG